MRATTMTIGLFLSLGVLSGGGCKRTQIPDAGPPSAATAMGSWQQWADLTPLVDVAGDHADERTIAALREASALMREGRFKSADESLSKAGGSHGRHWIAVARGDIAALSFTVCIRGVAWRLEDGRRGSPTDREVDFSEDTRVAPGDISVEATLTNLDDAITQEVPALVTQARIARARVAAFAARCPANEDVARLAEKTMETDLATLAAENSLTPDLAYLWAGVQMTRFSGAAARPFLEQAIEGGYDHPAATLMLAIIALEGRDLAQAETLAKEALAGYAEIGDVAQQAQAQFIRGEIARSAEKPKDARRHYESAIELMPRHVSAMLAVAGLERDANGERAAATYLHGNLPVLMFGDRPLDPRSASEVAANLETLVIMASEPFMAQLTRDALLSDIDDEVDPMRRALRYFFAATLDIRLREYELARGHAVLAREEMAESELPSPIDVDGFLDRLREATG